MGSVGRKWISGFSALVLTLGLAVVAPGTAQASVGTTPRVLINEVYGGGGNSGATLKQDFIELYNGTSAAVDLSTYSVQYNSATGTGTWQVTPLSGMLPAGSSYVVREAAGTGGTADVTGDVTGTIAMSGSAGQVALVNSTHPADLWHVLHDSGRTSSTSSAMARPPPSFAGGAPAPGADQHHLSLPLRHARQHGQQRRGLRRRRPLPAGLRRRLRHHHPAPGERRRQDHRPGPGHRYGLAVRRQDRHGDRCGHRCLPDRRLQRLRHPDCRHRRHRRPRHPHRLGCAVRLLRRAPAPSTRWRSATTSR